MRTIVFVLLLPVLLPAVDLRPVTIAPEGAAIPTEARRNGTPEARRFYQPLIGTIDTVGGTTYDWWCNGPEWRIIYNTPGYGLHIMWMYSQEMASTTFPDRNQRYNFYDYSTSTWNWIDPDYMQSGVNVFPDRSGYGSLGAALITGCAYVSRHSSQTGTIHAGVARDIAPGAGIFEYADGNRQTDGYQWPPIAIDGQANVHLFPITAAYELAYTRILNWNWPYYDTLVRTGWDPPTTFPTHNCAASVVSQKVACTWTDNVDPVSYGYLRISEDGGTTWNYTETLPAPAIYGGDTVASWHITSLFPFYDQFDQLHIVASVIPVVNDTGYIIPSGIVHYVNGVWTVIARAGCDPSHLMAGTGYNATYADRPTIGEDEEGNLLVVWEQFDSANVEPLTSVLRADVFASGSGDGGLTWTGPFKLTDAGSSSCRFPCATNWVSNNNSLDIIYLLDQTAGFWVQNEHPGEINPVIVHHVPTRIPMGNAGRAASTPLRPDVGVSPNPVLHEATVSYAVPKSGEVALVLRDATGRVVQTLASGRREAGRYSERLSAGKLPAGVYFLTLEAGDTRLSRKVILSR